MAITFACESCGKTFHVADTLAGKKARCKQCGRTMRIPAGGPPVHAYDLGDGVEGEAASPLPRDRGEAPAPPRPAKSWDRGGVRRKAKPSLSGSVVFALGVMAVSLVLIGVAAFATFIGGAESRVFGLTLGMIGLGWALWGVLWTFVTPVEMSVSRLAIIPINLVHTGYLIRFLFESWKNDIRPLCLILAGFAAFAVSMPFVPRGGRGPGGFGQFPGAGAGAPLGMAPQPDHNEPPPDQPLPPSRLDGPSLEPGGDLSALPAATESGSPWASDRLTDLRAVVTVPGQNFRDVGPEGAYLVGARISYGPNPQDSKKIGSIQPIYRSGDNLVAGPRYGNPQGDQFEVVAEPGYAVAAIRTHTGLLVDGFDFVFMRVAGGRLDPSDSKASPWIGDREGGNATYVLAKGQPAVGIIGRRGEHEVSELSLVGLKP
jgi:hypothetical protein